MGLDFVIPPISHSCKTLGSKILLWVSSESSMERKKTLTSLDRLRLARVLGLGFGASLIYQNGFFDF